MDKISGMIRHYVGLFNNQTFDEYDVNGFLILIRNDRLKQNQPHIYDFANIVAHRIRSEGVAFRAMNAAKNNNFEKNSTGSVKGFCGVSYGVLVKEIKSLSKRYNFMAEKQFCRDFILCLMSIAQDVICKKDEESQIICELKLVQGKDGVLALGAMGKDTSICYLLYTPKFNFENDYPAGLITDAVEAIRVDGKLERHFCESGIKI